MSFSALLPTSSRRAAVGYRAIRQYAATALQSAPEVEAEVEASSSPGAGPSRPRSTPKVVSTAPRLNLTESGHSSVDTSSTPLSFTNRARASRSPRDFARNAAIRKAAQFASALESTSSSTTSSSLPRPTAETPKLEDLLSKRPLLPTRPPHHAAYRTMYNRVYSSINGAFVRDQLVDMVNQLGWTKTSKHNKHRIISQLLAEWGWAVPITQEAPGPIEKMGFEMETAQIFLLMREGDGLAPLLKAKNYPQPTFNIIPAKPLPGKEKAEGETPDPSRSILQVKAPKNTLEKFADLARIRRSEIRTEIIPISELGGQRPPPDFVHALCNLHDCYVEYLGNDVLRLSSSEQSRIRKTARVLVQAFSRRLPVLANHITALVQPVPTPETTQYDLNQISLSPFHPSQHGLPWDATAWLAGSPVGRLRRTVIWDAKPSRAEQTQREELIEGAEVWARGAAQWMRDLEGSEDVSMKNLVRWAVGVVEKSAAPVAKTSVVMTFGHLIKRSLEPLPTLLYAGSKTPTPSDPKPISPPEVGLFFIPCPTPSMIQYPLQTSSRKVHRLRYRSIDTVSEKRPNRHLVFSWNYPTKPDLATMEEIDEEEGWQMEMDRMMEKVEKDVGDQEDSTEAVRTEMAPELEQESENEVHENETIAGSADPLATPWNADIKIDIHTLCTADLRMPDRPVDAHLSARSTSPLMPRTLPWNSVHPRERISAVREFFLGLERRVAGTEQKVLKLAPAHVTVEIEGRDHRFALIAEEECEITEVERGDGVILRTTKSFEPNIAWSKPTSYTELESRTGEVSRTFWRALADVSREVPANAGASLREIQSF